MRVFIAVPLPSAVRNALRSTLQPLRGLEANLAWEQPERWHITLTFLGDVDDDLITALSPRLERAASRTQPFTLALDGLSRFGRRVLYAKVDGDRAALRRLAERTTAAARRAGVEVGDGRLRPHVTVARSRHGADLRSVVGAGGIAKSADWQVDEFVVVQSVLGRDRRYQVLERYGLAVDT